MSEECVPCRIGKNVCRILDKNGEKRCQEIYEAVLNGQISGVKGNQALNEAFGEEKVLEAFKLAVEIQKRAKNYEKSMLKFLGESESEVS